MSKTVEQQIADIKAHMPETYKAIQAKADVIGRPAFNFVRRGLKGEANCFYAFEAGYVVGTPFTLVEVARDVAMYMVCWGTTFCVVWSPAAVPAAPQPNPPK